MRKLSTKEQEEKRQKRNQKIVSLVIVLLMIGSGFGIIVNSFGSQDNASRTRAEYNDFVFFKSGNYWITETQSQQLVFEHLPDETNFTLNSEINPLSSYKDRVLYIYSEDALAGSFVASNLQNFVQRIQLACVENKICNGDYPIKDNCDDNFIKIEISNKTQIKQENSCVFIQSDEENLVKITEEFLYNLFEIK